MGFGVLGLGFRASGLGLELRFWRLGSGVRDRGFEVWGFGVEPLWCGKEMDRGQDLQWSEGLRSDP